jgi:presenilin-like A22 family membrane protease
LRKGLKDEFNVTATHLLPEVWTLIVAGVLAVLILESKIEVQVITQFPETPVGATMNMTIFVVLMAVMATLMYLLVKYGLEKIFRTILRIAIVCVLFVLLIWYLTALFALLRVAEEIADLVILSASLILTSVLTYAINRTKGVPQLVATTLLGAMVGTFLGASIPTLTAIILLVGLACYDIFAVFKGPIGKIAEKTDLESLSGATLTFGDLTVGLGDLVFYSMLAGHTMLSFGFIPYAMASIGIVVGTYLGFKMLEKRSAFPGLPLSLIIGLGFMLVTVFLRERLFS